MKQCESCKPDKLNCTPKSFVNKIKNSKDPLVAQHLVEKRDGTLRQLTKNEEKQLGIEHLPISKKTKDELLIPYGTQKHCPYRLRYRNPVTT